VGSSGAGSRPGASSANDSYGGRSLHEQSHGESFLALICHRFGDRGLYILDEPEAALSPTRQLSLLRRVHALARSGSQFIIATHSPILMAYPDAERYLLTDGGIRTVRHDETEHWQITKRFLADPGSMMDRLFADDDD
jgi:predicted ATPase